MWTCADHRLVWLELELVANRSRFKTAKKVCQAFEVIRWCHSECHRLTPTVIDCYRTAPKSPWPSERVWQIAKVSLHPKREPLWSIWSAWADPASHQKSPLCVELMLYRRFFGTHHPVQTLQPITFIVHPHPNHPVRQSNSRTPFSPRSWFASSDPLRVFPIKKSIESHQIKPNQTASGQKPSNPSNQFITENCIQKLCASYDSCEKLELKKSITFSTRIVTLHQLVSSFVLFIHFCSFSFILHLQRLQGCVHG